MKIVFSAVSFCSSLLIVLLLSASNLFSQEEILARHPAISPDGANISFSYQGDIWIAPFEGGMATRLTVHESYEFSPTFSRDGGHIVFAGNRHGNNDLFKVDINGSGIERLTWHSAGDMNPSLQSDGTIFFNTRRDYAAVEREWEIFRLDPNNKTPYRAMDALGFNPRPTDDGRLIAFESGTAPANREPYTGPAARDIYVYNTNRDRYHRITNGGAMHIFPRWAGRNLYYLSSESGVYNLYKQEITNAGEKRGEATQLTHFEEVGIRHFDISNDGSIVVFERGIGIHSLDLNSGDIHPIKVMVTRDFRFYPEEKKTFNSDANQYTISPNGKYAALTIRGEIFLTLNNKDHSNTISITDHAARDQNPAWLTDSTLLFVSDRDGQFQIYASRSSDPDHGDIFRTLQREVVKITDKDQDVMNFWLSNSRERIAIQIGRGKLVTADIDSIGNINNVNTLLDGWATPGGLKWSPDDQWLAYSLPDLNFNTEIYIHAADNSKEPVNISMHPRRDLNPYWSKDGSKLAFASDRNNQDFDIWFVWLREEDWERTRTEWTELEIFGDESPANANRKNGDNGEEDEEETEDKLITIDFDRIHDRLVQVTRDVGNEWNIMISHDGETFYFTGNSPSGNLLQSIKWDGSDRKTLAENFTGGSLELSSDGKDIYYLDRGRLQKISTSGGRPDNIPYSARMTIRHKEEMGFMFEEGWRIFGMGFYDPQFHGRNWEALKERYKPKAMAASTRQDFRDMFNHMLAQLDASHLGMFGGNPEETQADKTGRLGVELKPVNNGLEVTRVVMRSPAERESSRLSEGDIIRAINGVAVHSGENFYQHLDEMANERVRLSVQSSRGEQREVIIRPANILNRQLYEEWVDERRKMTELASNGRLGYIHIQGMNRPSFERFERELMASGYGKEGILIDVRYNGGGFTTDLLMAILNTRQHSYTIPRGAVNELEEGKRDFRDNYPYSERLPFPVLMIPSITLINESSYSNAEIFAHAYKDLGHGELVGQPTFGAVISTGGYSLVDGTLVRMPFRGWFTLSNDENMENGPAVPNHLVENPVDAKGKGEDPQLKRAVELLLEQIDSEE
ncbi:MAG: PDZ domain-containing protein [Saprospirales bacterium]|nr:MAG: PDZ domain-containing protein [Saprospirales bacterium]